MVFLGTTDSDLSSCSLDAEGVQGLLGFPEVCGSGAPRLSLSMSLMCPGCGSLGHAGSEIWFFDEKGCIGVKEILKHEMFGDEEGGCCAIEEVKSCCCVDRPCVLEKGSCLIEIS